MATAGASQVGMSLFNRAMSWTCLAVAALMLVVAGSVMWTTVATASGGAVSCGHRGEAVGAQPCQSGGMTTISQVVYAPDGRVLSRRTLAATPADMSRWSPGNVGALFGAAPPVLLALALWQAGRFFAGLGGGRVFQPPTVRRLRNFLVLGIAFLLSDSLLEPLVNGVLGLFGGYSVRFHWPFAMYSSPKGASAWALSGAGVMEVVFLAALIAMVSVLARAAAIAEDHAQIV
jgi:hypothetical protein